MKDKVTSVAITSPEFRALSGKIAEVLNEAGIDCSPDGTSAMLAVAIGNMKERGVTLPYLINAVVTLFNFLGNQDETWDVKLVEVGKTDEPEKVH